MEDIQRILGVGDRVAGKVVVAPDLAADSDTAAIPGGLLNEFRSGGVLRVCFLSRISPKKNLDYALRVLGKILIPVKFSIYGPIEDDLYWVDCQKLISKMPSNIEVVHEGLIEPSRVVSELAKNDLFFFPTRGENYGHVIHEALRAGLPVLISDQTPWRGLTELGIGWDLSLSEIDQFADRIEALAAWDDKEHKRWSARAIAHAAKVAEDPVSVEANRRLFLDAINNSAPK